MPEQAVVIRWEEPPPATRSTSTHEGWSRFAAVAEELRANPRRWALVYEGRVNGASGLATHIRLGQMRCFMPTGDFDATSRQSAGVGRVYARYVGDGGGA